MELDGILKFIKLTHDFQKVERTLKVAGLDRKENDVEHSYQLALVAWYIVSVYNLDLDIDKVIKYALLHDLVEVYAGDTYVFDENIEVHETKAQREHEALQKLQTEFAEFPELIDLITRYEQHVDEESKFIYALDKILPPMNIYLDNGRTWKELDQRLEKIKAHAAPKVAKHGEIEKYFYQFMEMLEREHDQLFNQR